MTEEEFQNLETGDIIRRQSDTHGLVVIAHYGKYITAVRTVDIVNPAEWLLIPHDEKSLDQEQTSSSEEWFHSMQAWENRAEPKEDDEFHIIKLPKQ